MNLGISLSVYSDFCSYILHLKAIFLAGYLILILWNFLTVLDVFKSELFMNLDLWR